MEIKNIPPEPPNWPRNIQKKQERETQAATPALPAIVRVIPIQHPLQPQPPQNNNDEWANRPIVLNQRPAGVNRQQAENNKRIFKIFGILAAALLLAIILGKIIQTKNNLEGYSSSSPSQYEPTRQEKSDSADRLIRAIDKFLGK